MIPEELLRVYLIVCPMMFLAGVMDAVAGGGGLLSLPAFLIAGLPAPMALGTNKCGSAFGATLSAVRFTRHGQVHPSCVLAIPAAMAGSALGARLARYLPERALYYLLLASIPILAALLLLKPDLGKEDRTDRHSPKALAALAAGIGFVLGGYDGFFGPGSGTFMTMAFTLVAGFDLLTASGNTKVANCVSNITALLTFALAGQVNWVVGLPAAACGVAGHYLGDNLAFHNGAKVIRPMFFVVLGLLAVRLVSDLAA